MRAPGPAETPPGAAGARRRAGLCAIVYLLLLLPTTALSSGYNMRFTRDLNVWSWEQSLVGSRQVTGKLSVDAQALHSKRVSEFSTGSRRSHATQASLTTGYAFTPQISLLARMAADDSRQEVGADESSILNRELVGILHYQPMAAVSLKPYVGGAHDRRRGLSDTGVTYGVNATLNPLQESLARHGSNLSLAYRYDAVSSRQGDVSSDIWAEFGHAWSPKVRHTITYIERRDDQKYVASDEVDLIQDRSTADRRAETALQGDLPLIGSVDARLAYTYGRVRDDASADSTDLKYRTNNNTKGIEGALAWTPIRRRASLTYSVTVGRSTRDAEPVEEPVPGFADSVRHAANRLDRRASTLGMSLNSGVRITDRDSLRLGGSLSLSCDHTPAEAEVNDRDDYRRSFTGRVQPPVRAREQDRGQP